MRAVYADDRGEIEEQKMRKITGCCCDAVLQVSLGHAEEADMDIPRRAHVGNGMRAGTYCSPGEGGRALRTASMLYESAGRGAVYSLNPVYLCDANGSAVGCRCRLSARIMSSKYFPPSKLEGSGRRLSVVGHPKLGDRCPLDAKTWPAACVLM